MYIRALHVLYVLLFAIKYIMYTTWNNSIKDLLKIRKHFLKTMPLLSMECVWGYRSVDMDMTWTGIASFWGHYRGCSGHTCN